MNPSISSSFDCVGEFDCRFASRNDFNHKSAALVRPRPWLAKARKLSNGKVFVFGINNGSDKDLSEIFVIENANKEPVRESKEDGFVFEVNLIGDMKKLVYESFGNFDFVFEYKFIEEYGLWMGGTEIREGEGEEWR
ncbi:hypothetical protein V6N11_071387 [Hibiscus sabdariffa]|uniref:Uncharacterized protein n=1 Tax=Hibiscus sabdariffa TaxID=183260 RepID=A0ABR2U002_9ROSI